MNKSIKYFVIGILFFMLTACSQRENVFVGDTVDIEDFKRPANIIKYQWSFDTKPPTSRLDPRDFIPSNYHPNVTFIPDVRGRYIVRLTMINDEGNVIHKNFDFKAEAQPDYLADIESEKKGKPAEPEKKSPEAKTTTIKPKIIEVPKVTEKTILKKTIITKRPNEWKIAPKPGEELSDVKQEPAFFTESVTELTEDAGSGKLLSKSQKTETAKAKDSSPLPESVKSADAKYTVQVASSPSKAPSYEFLEKMKKQGFDAYIQTATVNGVLYYRIRVGRYASYQDAKSALEKIKGYPEYRKLQPWIDKTG